ncbi:MAG: DUF5979 domain-containing protein [Angelakisella sp.]|nr:DUF5979 domain-containing protein [Angelakisella sp.]
MAKKNGQLLISWLMALMMIVNVLSPFSMAYAAEVSASTLTNLTATITQDGATISEGGTITSTMPIQVEISFGVPVEGDDPTPSAPIQKGDTLTFGLSSGFTLLSGDTIELKFGTLPVGHVTLTTDPLSSMVTATVIFDGDDSVFDGTSNTVMCRFEADLEYESSGDSGNTGNHAVTILEKTYTVNVPVLPIEYNVVKEGTLNLADQSITWKVDINATQGGEGIDLTGYQFFDDLLTVGDYIPSSFKVDGMEDTPDTADNALCYIFPDGSFSPKTITFETKISDSKFYGTSKQTVTNKAQLLDLESTAVDESQFEVSFTPKWIEKAGVSSDTGSTGIYDPKNRTITWTITANHMGATLNNVVINDKLLNGLTLKSAKWQAWEGSDWGTDNEIIPGADGEYAIGNISSKILLTIVSNVPDDSYTTGTSSYSNSATIKWDGLPDPGLGTGSIDVGVGYNAMSKSGVADTSNQKIRWTVTTDTKGQEIPDLRVYDLLVYGSNINLSTVTGIPSGISPADLAPQYGQKYAGNFSGEYTVNVIPVMQGATQVADLIEIIGLSTSTSNTFSFDSQIVNPNIFAGNKTSTVRNTATLFSASTRLNAAVGSVNYTNRMLSKEMLKRQAMVDPISGVNSSLTTNALEAFDYEDKSAIFRLSVNADGIDVTNTTEATGQILGTAILTDTLPDGWEFVDIIPGSKYVIFEGTGQSNGTVLAADTTPDTVEGLDASFSAGTAEFTFSSLSQPYVILVKAKPTSETAAQYFSSNNTKTERNRVNLKTEKWSTGVSSYRDITIVSKVLEKNTMQPTAGELLWWIDYKPYDLVQNTKKLEDQLPVGIDLRMDAKGSLLLKNNIAANEMTLNADGSYTEGSPVTLELGTNLIYDNATRILSFIIPDSAKAYRLSYITDVTGEPGIVTNKVSLIGVSTELEQTFKPYVILASDGSATLKRNGWVGITKINGSGAPLAGVEFTLYAMDGTTVIKKGVTQSDGTLRLKVIPDGEYILRETAVPDGYTLEGISHSVIVSTNGSTITTSIDGKVGANSNTIAIQNFSQGTAGNLTISKAVAGEGADTGKSFNFTLTLNGTTETYSYIGRGVPGGTIKSGDTVALAHGQSITVVGLPKDTSYVVAEADYSHEGYATASTGTTGSIVADATQTAAFTNTRTVGSLTISKTVAGNTGDTKKKFDFTLTLDGAGATGTYAYIGNGVPNGTIKSGDTVALAHGESITIEELPKGARYTVTEADYSGDLYSTTSTGEAGSIVADATQTAAFTNTRTVGSLTISKTVAGNAGNTKKKFDFTLTLEGAGTTGTYAYVGNGVPSGTIKSGDTVALAHGESITIEELPAGTAYVVTEADYSGDRYKTTHTGATGTIETDIIKIASFTNTRNASRPSSSYGTLTISKTVAGVGADTTKKFHFTVTLDGASGIYHYTGNGVKDGMLKSGDTVSLAHGQSITIIGLRADTAYRVVEDSTSSQGYFVESAGSSGTIISGEDKTAAFTNTKLSTSGGSLTIKKTVTGEGASLTKKFKFTVTFARASNAYPYTGAASGFLLSGDSVLLADGESITITGLPAGIKYTVTEADYSKEGYTSSGTGASGFINLKGLQTASFVNTFHQAGVINVGENGMPDTGETRIIILAKLALLYFSIALMVLFSADFILRKNYFRKKNRK